MRYSEPESLILLCLLDGQKHGYAIGDELEALMGERPGPGTLYGAITRLEEKGMIVERSSRDRRKPFALTRRGEERARDEVARLESLAREGRRRLKLRPDR